MKKWFQWVRRTLTSFFSQTSAAVAPEVASAPPMGHNRPSRRTAPSDTFGAYYYLDNVLDDLKDYFDALALMKRIDPDCYDYYSRVGARVVSRKSLLAMEVPPLWRSGERPSMGMIHITDTDVEGKRNNAADDSLHTSFYSFQRFARKGDVAALGGKDDLYEIVGYLRDYEWAKVMGKSLERFRRTYIRKYGDPAKGVMFRFAFHAAIDRDGNAKVLKERKVSLTGPRRDIPRITWDYPMWLADLAKERGEAVNAIANEIFKVVSGGVENAADGVQVRAHQNGMTALFNVDMLRTPYFFKDRDKTVTANGRTRRIFHIARAHRRITAGGHATFVKTHFRGERKFTWNGYWITISMPGLHHKLIQHFDVPTYEVDDAEVASKPTMDAAQLGRAIDKHMAA